MVETKTDLKLLLDCLKCHMNETGVQRDSLVTVATMCSTSEDCQEFFRECGGINFVLSLLTSTKDNRVKAAAIYTLGCACERNVFSQKRLCTGAVFQFLNCQLASPEVTDDLKRTVAFLLVCLVTNNGEGQNLIRESHSLDVMLILFRTLYFSSQNHRPGSPSEICPDGTPKSTHLELWTTITSTLCGCVNNPQNEVNQHLCASVFPTALDILCNTIDLKIVRLIASFLALAIASNARNQDGFGKLGGLEVLVQLLSTIIEGLVRQPDQDAIQAAVQLANLFISCATDSDDNQTKLVDLSLVPLLVQLLSMDFIEVDVRLKLIVTLGRLTEKCENSQRQLLESDGLPLLVNMMSSNHDEEFTKPAMYLLSNCISIASHLYEVPNETRDDTDLTQAIPKQPIIPQRQSLTRVCLDGPVHDGTQKQQLKIRKDENRAGNNRAVINRKMTTKCASASTTATTPQQATKPCRPPTIEEQLISYLQAQLEEKNKKEHLENKDVGGWLEMSGGKGEAITGALERQDEEQRMQEVDEEQGVEDEEDEDVEASTIFEQIRKQPVVKPSASVMSNQSIQKLSNKIDSLEEKLDFICKLGDQLGDQLTNNLNKNQVPKDSSTVLDIGVGLSVGKNRTASGNNPGGKNAHTDASRQSGSGHFRNVQEKFLDSLQALAQSNGTQSSNYNSNSINGVSDARRQPDVFRVPTLPVRRRPNARRRLLPLESSLFSLQPKGAVYSRSNLKFSNALPGGERADSDIVSLSESDVALVNKSRWKPDRCCTRDDRLGNNIRAGEKHPLKPLHHTVGSQVGGHLDAATPSPNGANPCSPSQPSTCVSTASKRAEGRTVRDQQTMTMPLSCLSHRSFNVKGLLREPVLVPACPGCAPPINRPLLNSRNFLYTLERSQATCPDHRDLHRLIRRDMTGRAEMKNKGEAAMTPAAGSDVCSNIIRKLKSATRRNNSPTSSISTISSVRSFSTTNTDKVPRNPPSSKRRKRQEFTFCEINNLIKGVDRLGKHWNSILWTYNFKKGRTAVDLKDKYRRLRAKEYPGVISPSSSRTSD